MIARCFYFDCIFLAASQALYLIVDCWRLWSVVVVVPFSSIFHKRLDNFFSYFAYSFHGVPVSSVLKEFLDRNFINMLKFEIHEVWTLIIYSCRDSNYFTLRERYFHTYSFVYFTSSQRTFKYFAYTFHWMKTSGAHCKFGN